jgi:hypothetical protein
LRKASGKEEERKRGREEWENKKGNKRRNNVSKINKCKNKKRKEKGSGINIFFSRTWQEKGKLNMSLDWHRVSKENLSFLEETG